jgi:hypothetical protein
MKNEKKKKYSCQCQKGRKNGYIKVNAWRVTTVIGQILRTEEVKVLRRLLIVLYREIHLMHIKGRY